MQAHILNNFNDNSHIGTLTDAPNTLIFHELTNTKLQFYCYIKNHQITKIRYKILASSVGMAYLAVLSRYLEGKTIAEIKQLNFTQFLRIFGQIEPHRKPCLQTIFKGIKTFILAQD